MGMKYCIESDLYEIKGSINCKTPSVLITKVKNKEE
jgi:hypothetical protein